ncbi:MAG: S8 family serine peptidase [Synergistaceae bacterium]|nr:S8 family serine peptidase [Synergistaceae bacterium]
MISSRKFFSAFFTIIILSLSSCSFAHEYSAGDVIVVLRNSDSDERVTASSFSSSEGIGSVKASEFAVKRGASLKKTYPALSEMSNNVFALIHSDDIDPEEFTKELMKNPNVLAASPNYIVKAAVVPNDTHMSELWGMNAINMPSAWEKETGSSSVYVAILDSGIDWTNPDVSANVASNLGFTANGITSNYAGFDDYGHGTHVAGTIGAISNNSAGIAGMNWNVKMIPVKVLNSRGSGSTATVIEGMNYVASLMSKGYNIRAVNLSLVTYINMAPVRNTLISYPMWRAFKTVDEYNKAVIVVAAGNDKVAVGEPTTKTTSSYTAGSYAYPASFTGLDNMISVSAVNTSGNLASYSNTNADISAPGGDANTDKSLILSTWIQDSKFVNDEGISLRSEQGTSMAAPHIAGAAALLAAHDPDMTAYQIKQCILDSAGSGGEGILDVDAALEYQESYASSLESNTSENDSYSSWKDNSSNNNSSSNSNNNNNDYGNNYSSSSSGGCNGFMPGILAVIFLYPIAKKFMN